MYGYHNIYSLNWILLTQEIAAIIIIIITSDSCKLGDSRQILSYVTPLHLTT